MPIRSVEIPKGGRVVHLRGLGFVKVFRTVSKDGDAEYWTTNDLEMTEDKRTENEGAFEVKGLSLAEKDQLMRGEGTDYSGCYSSLSGSAHI